MNIKTIVLYKRDFILCFNSLNSLSCSFDIEKLQWFTVVEDALERSLYTKVPVTDISKNSKQSINKHFL